MAPRGESASLAIKRPSFRFQMPTQFRVTVTASGWFGARLNKNSNIKTTTTLNIFRYYSQITCNDKLDIIS